LAELLVNRLAPIADETRRLLNDEAYLVQLLREGAGRADALAEPIVKEAERIVGFVS
jgi:tryptophanyl-tRNA synthetase